MNLIVHKTNNLVGVICSPGSKSHSIRGILLALLANGQSVLKNCLISDDTHCALQVCRSLGSEVQESQNSIIISNHGLPITSEIRELNTGNSGITTHFILPILGLRHNKLQPMIVDCEEQMRSRPIRFLVDALRQLGLTIDYLKQDDQLPVAISGELIGGETEVSGISSQYVSALLVSLPCAKQDSTIWVKNLRERPYVEMTLDWLNKQSIRYSHKQQNNMDVFFIKGNQQYKSFTSTIPGDFSSASYLISASVLVNGKIEIHGLNMQDSQGDKHLVTILQNMGADINIKENSLIITGGRELQGIDIDAVDIPDLLPTLAVIGTHAASKTVIRNVGHARIKETDRIQSMMKGLTAMGARIKEHHDGLTIYNSQLQGVHVNGFSDHRTVMALSLAGMLAEGTTTISDAEAINKTFPTYVDCMRSLGASMQIDNDTF